jgi:UDP-N-acetylmuramate: L-alanyl-gamma-D-glutamyl-meso-diaminopimelate ligase
MGCWTPGVTFALAGGGASRAGAGADWSARIEEGSAAGRFAVLYREEAVAQVNWPLLGEHNVMNALAAIAAAQHAGVAPTRAAEALGRFSGVKRRMELRGVIGGVAVYDDFAHHPTAIATTLAGLRARVGGARIIAVLEARSNTMKLGVHREQLAPSFTAADRAWFLNSPDLGWDLPSAVAPLGARAAFAPSVDELVQRLTAESRPGDHILVMSNGGFGGLHDKLLAALKARK